MSITKQISDSQAEDFKNIVTAIKSNPELSGKCDFAVAILENAISSKVAGLWTDGYETSGAYTKR